MPEALWNSTALELAALIRGGRVSSREVVQAHLDRIGAVNGQLRAITRVLGDEALEAADRADRALAAGEASGAFHGVPLTVKENIDVAGSATTHGVPLLKDMVPARDEPIVERMRLAGAIPIARTNLPDMGLRLDTESALHGRTYNPWDPARTPGGSSGGEAAALATGMSPLGLGNDFCGSLRWPSQCCGVAALKPTLGVIPRGPMPIPMFGVDLMMVHGPMARSVSDLRAGLAALAGYHPGDPWSVPASDGVCHRGTPIRVALVLDPGGGGVDARVASGLKHAARALEDAGYIVEEREPPCFSEAVDLWAEINLSSPSPEGLENVMSKDARRVLELWGQADGLEPASVRVADALGRRSLILREWALFFEQHALLLAPTAAEQPFEIGADLVGVEATRRIVNGHRVIKATSALCLPSVVMPVGLADGLPQSAQLIGPRFGEALCLEAAEAIERRMERMTPIDPRSDSPS
jgi:amidase